MTTSGPDVRTVRVIDGAGGGGGDTPIIGRYARNDRPKSEVRRCGRCEKPAVIVCQAWTHTLSNVETGRVTRDCRCQACGASVTLRDPKAIRLYAILSLALGFLVVPLFGLPFVYAWRRAWDKTPLVPDAAFPEVRYWRGPGNRRCGACGKIARLESVTRNTHNGIPMGTDCSYRCEGCSATFETESAGGLLVNLLGAALFGGGALAWLASQQGLRLGWGLALSVAALGGGVFFVYTFGKRVGAALRNPRLEGPEAAG